VSNPGDCFNLASGSVNCNIPSEDFKSDESEGVSFASKIEIREEQWLTWEENDYDVMKNVFTRYP